MYGYTYTSYTAHDREVWAARMADALLTATRFTVHCWHEEKDAIAMACRRGEIVPGDWVHGVYISGAVTVDVSSSEDGFIFRLLTDRWGDIICFKAAWLPIGAHGADECTAAADFFVT